ncbi:MAG: hypothetical protein M0Z99_30990 [Betaproteobacteria bacterium]|nr:hypothetical protein [Betaproteobacteria bacterium]
MKRAAREFVVPDLSGADAVKASRIVALAEQMKLKGISAQEVGATLGPRDQIDGDDIPTETILRIASMAIREMRQGIGVDAYRPVLDFALGYLVGLRNGRTERTHSMSRGRRGVGAKSSQWVKDKAKKYLGGRLSKKAVAARLANQKPHNLSASRIEKLLTELFPGKSWKTPAK